MSGSSLRGFGALCLVLCGWCVGDSICVRTSEHQRALQRTIELLDRIRREIEFRRADLASLFVRLQREGLVGQAAGALQELEPFPQLSRREKAAFQNCMAGLGRAEAQQEWRIKCAFLWGWRRPFCCFERMTEMEIDLIFKIAAIGIIVAVLNQLLIRSGREDQAMMTTLAGLVVVLSILVKQISVLFVTIKSLFSL